MELEKERIRKERVKKGSSGAPPGGSSPPEPPGPDKRLVTAQDLHEHRNLGNARAVQKIEPGGGGGGGGGGGRAGGSGAGGKLGKLGKSGGKLAKFGKAGIDVARFLVSTPDPTDALLLWITSYAAPSAEALKEQKSEKYALGFSEGLSGQLLGLPSDFVKDSLIHQAARYGNDIGGFSIPKENASNRGAVEGYIFGFQRTPEEATALLKKGLIALAAKNSGVSLSNPTLDDVISLSS